MTYQEFKTSLPHKSIESIWYVDSSQWVAAHTASPELSANLIIKLYPNNSEVVWSGAVTKQQTYPYIPDAQYFGIRFRPGYSCLSNLASLYDMRNTSIDVPQHTLRHWNHLEERLRDKHTLQEQIRELCQGLLKITHSVTELPDNVHEALYYVHRQRGVMTIHELSQLTLISQRQLERLFKSYLGLSPKTVCDIVRIQEILHLLWQPSKQCTLSDIALQFGYVDQAHLANDFRKFMGQSISDYTK